MALDLEYLRVKLIITLLRLVSWITDFLPLRRDRLQSQLTYKHTRQRVLIPSRDKHRSIKADLYLPPNHHHDTDKILINWHGSGFIFPALGSDTLFCARVASEIGIAVLDADYRKAPETPFPGAVEDVEDVLRWVFDTMTQKSTTTTAAAAARVAVSGFSSGGNLALVAASALRKQQQQLLAAVLAFYPIVDMTLAPEAKRAPRVADSDSGSAAPPHVARMFKGCYLPDPAMYADTRASPGLADAADFPSTVAILTCDGDKLAPEAMALAEKLKLDGKRKVVGEMVRGVSHGFDKGTEKGTLEWERREEMYALAVRTLKEVFNG
jgi:acetyl esterase/lipase